MGDEVQILVTSTPPDGYRWEIVGRGQLLKSGTAATEAEARSSARKALEAAVAKGKEKNAKE